MEVEKIKARTMNEYQSALKVVKPVCRWCKQSLALEEILSYEHPYGYKTLEIRRNLTHDSYNMVNPKAIVVKKLWLYVRCPGCGYDWSLRTLGVRR